MGLRGDQWHTRIFREDDSGFSDPSKLVESNQNHHEAGMKALDLSKLNPVMRFFAYLFGNTVEWGGKTYLVGEKSLAAFMRRNQNLFSQRAPKVNMKFNVKLALADVKKIATNRLKNVTARLPLAKRVESSESILIVASNEMERIFDVLGITDEVKQKIAAKFWNKEKGNYEIHKNSLVKVLQENNLNLQPVETLGQELHELRSALAFFMTKNDKAPINNVLEKIITVPTKEREAEIREHRQKGSAEELLERFDALTSKDFRSLTFDDIQEIRKLKKEAKAMLARATAASSTDIVRLKGIIESYDAFHKANAVLCDIQFIMKELKKVPDAATCEQIFPLTFVASTHPKLRNLFCRFRNLITQGDSFTEWQEIEDLQKSALLRAKLRARIFAAHQEIHRTAPELMKHHISWAHGASSGVMVSLFKITMPKAGAALIPTGQLLKHNIVPLTGELGWGVSPMGVNRYALSGVDGSNFDVAVMYANKAKFLFNSEVVFKEVMKTSIESLAKHFDRFKIQIIRLKLMGAPDEQITQILQHINQLATDLPIAPPRSCEWEDAAGLFGKQKDTLGDFVTQNTTPIQIGSTVYIERSSGSPSLGIVTAIQGASPNLTYTILLDTDGTPINATEQHIEHIKIVKKANSLLPHELDDYRRQIGEGLKTLQERLEDLKKIIQSTQAVAIDNEDRQFLEDSFPIIWASYTEEPQGLFLGLHGEKILEGPQALGTKIQVVFTDTKHVELVNKYIKKHLQGTDIEIKVLSLDSAYYALGHTATGVGGKGQLFFSEKPSTREPVRIAKPPSL